MKRDILDRELHDYDLVVVKGSGGHGYAAKPMEVGVFLGKSVRTINGIRSAKDMYLIENPGSMELSLKTAILEKLEEEKAAAKAKQAQKNKQTANVVGRVYKMSKEYEVWLYCGQKRVTIYKDGTIIRQNEGHLYLSAGRWIRDNANIPNLTFEDFIKENVRRITSYGGYEGIDVLQSHKKYEMEFHTMSIPDEFKFSGTHTWRQGNWNGRSSFSQTHWTTFNDKYEVVIEDI